MIRKKLAVLSDHPVFPPHRGGETRVFNLLKGLAGYLEIELLSSSKRFWRRTHADPTGEEFSESHVPQNPLQVLSWFLLSRFDRDPVADIVYGYTWRLDFLFRQQVRSALASAEVVLVERPCIFPLLLSLKPQRPLIVYDAHDVNLLLKQEMLLPTRLRDVFLSKTREMEETACKRSDLILAACRDDRAQLSALYNVPAKKIFVVPHGVDTDSIAFRSAPDREASKRRLGFTGPLVLFLGSAHPPNLEAARFISQELATEHKECTFLLIGKAGEALRKAGTPVNVRIAGLVSEEEKNIMAGACDIAINPMFHGSGTNYKMLEYMAMGLPVISTGKGARGLDLEDGQNVVLAPVEKFGERMEYVLGNRDFAGEISLNARRTVEQEYDYRKIGKLVATIISEKVHADLSEGT